MATCHFAVHVKKIQQTPTGWVYGLFVMKMLQTKSCY